MEFSRLFTVRDWVKWAALEVDHVRLLHLPTAILDAPLDQEVMTFRVKCFAASVAIHQSLVDAGQIHLNEDTNHLPVVIERVPQDLLDRRMKASLQALQRLANEARHSFAPRPPGRFRVLYRESPPLPERPTNVGLPAGWESTDDSVSGRPYFFNLCIGAVQWQHPTSAIRSHVAGSIFEILDHDEEDEDWIFCRLYTNLSPRLCKTPAPGGGWLPSANMGASVLCRHNILLRPQLRW